MNYRQLADHAKQRARLLGQRMKDPSDDWYPEVHFLLPNRELKRQSIDPAYFRGRETKERLFTLLAQAVRAGGVRIMTLQVVMFGLTSEHPLMQLIAEREAAGHPHPTEGLPYFQDVEGSVEALWVHVFDAERHEAWFAPITRHDRGRPQLGVFELAGDKPDAFGGALVDPIKEALR